MSGGHAQSAQTGVIQRVARRPRDPDGSGRPNPDHEVAGFVRDLNRNILGTGIMEHLDHEGTDTERHTVAIRLSPKTKEV